MTDIKNSSSIMMSDTLLDNISDVATQDYDENYIITNVSFIVCDSIEIIAGSVVSIEKNGEFQQIEIRVMTEDAFSLIDSWQHVKISHYELFFGHDTVLEKGPFRISLIGIKDINPKSQTSIVMMKLFKE